MSEWKKVITEDSIAELKSLISSGNLKIVGGKMILNNLPTSDPGIVGRLWNDETHLRISEG
jgi:hypothetical protein